MDALASNASNLNKVSGVRKSLRVKKPKIFYDPSDIKRSRGQRLLSTKTTAEEATSSLSLSRTTISKVTSSIVAKKVSHSAKSTYSNNEAAAGFVVPSATCSSDRYAANNIKSELPTTARGNGEIPYGVVDSCDFYSIKKWSVEDVADFFGKYFPSIASKFRYHQIDGVSLLLIKRKDIITRFNLKMGHALNLYQLVRLLQTKDDDLVYTWRTDGLTFSGSRKWKQIIRLTN